MLYCSVSEVADGYVVELGAQFIHGVINNPIFELAKKYKLLSESTLKNIPPEQAAMDPRTASSPGYQVYSESGLIPDHEVMRETLQAVRHLLYPCEDHPKNSPGEADDSGYSLETYVRHHIEKDYLSMYSDKARQIRASLIDHWLVIQCVEEGCNSLSELSATSFYDYTDLPGGHVLLWRGYQKIIQKMAETIPTGAIKLHSPVTKIDWREITTTTSMDGIHLGLNGEVKERHNQRKKVKLYYGGDLSCQSDIDVDHVIVTCSLGCLKHSTSSMFTPSLPREKLAAIERLDMGVLEKIMLHFDNLDFIPVGTTIIYLLRDDPLASETQHWLRQLVSYDVISNERQKTLVGK